MRNSEHPVTSDFAKKLQEATDGEAGFRNLDVRALMRDVRNGGRPTGSVVPRRSVAEWRGD